MLRLEMAELLYTVYFNTRSQKVRQKCNIVICY